MKILKLSEVVTMTSIGRSSIYEKIKLNEFPKPTKLGKRRMGWLESDVEKWIKQQFKVD